MPTPRRPRPTRTGRNEGRRGNAAVADVSPEELSALQASLSAREQAPSSRQQAGANVNWARVRDQLGDPFDLERIPLSRLRLMRRDPMLAFGLSFIKTPFARAKWYINAKDTNGPNAQVAANVDWALRRIFAGFVFQWMNSLDFGFSAVAKRYEFRTPAGTYIDPGQGDGAEKSEQPLWSEGNVQPLVWKPFVALPPEAVEALWTGAGDFNGIQYNAGSGGAPGGIGASQSGDPSEFKIDVYHALWATHAKEENFGSIYGYPRLGHAYQYWWAYWFKWAIANRAFEKKGDPATIVRHPDDEIDLGDGTTIPAREYALDIGERLRAGATISLPSEVYMGEIDGKPSTTRLWDIEFAKDMADFPDMEKSYDYMDVMKLRSLWIPEQAFLEGKGGTSSRNVAKELGDSFVESQAVLAVQLVDTINRWVIPQFVAYNFPEFIASGGVAELVMEGFADQDVDARNNVLQFIGQQEQGSLELLKLVDLEKLLDDSGIPLLSFREQTAREQKLIAERQAAAAPDVTVEPVPGQSVGVVPTSTGFNGYIQPREVIYLSDSTSSFLERLPDSRQYADPTVRRSARELWQEWHSLYGQEYDSFAQFLDDLEELEFADDDGADLRTKARRIIKRWQGENELLGRVLDRTTDLYKKVMSRASTLEKKEAKLESGLDDETIDQWINSHAAEMVSSVSFTTREELANFLAEKMSEGVEDPKALAASVREHFSEFPGWKADRLARTEIRDAYNAATLLTAQANGAPRVQALDGTGDPECAERNGKVFSIDDAFKEREHPNGTLGWRILPVELSYRYADEELPEGTDAIYDDENHTVVFSQKVTDEERSEYLLMIGERLAA